MDRFNERRVSVRAAAPERGRLLNKSMTNTSNKIVPWICNVCQREFATSDGGICARCKQPTCRPHIRRLEETRKPAEWVCDHCITKKEANIRS